MNQFWKDNSLYNLKYDFAIKVKYKNTFSLMITSIILYYNELLGIVEFSVSNNDLNSKWTCYGTVML